MITYNAIIFKMELLHNHLYVFNSYIYIYVNVLAYEIQRGLNIALIEQMELYRLPQKVTVVTF